MIKTFYDTGLNQSCNVLHVEVASEYYTLYTSQNNIGGFKQHVPKDLPFSNDNYCAGKDMIYMA